ncbi:MAG: AAA family ATPase [Polaromonas sp.]|nr:AAA family ATPase [Polaromonas sp.]
MYSHHFGLTQDPFSIAPDPRYLFMSERHREALAHLLYGVAGVAGVAGVGGAAGQPGAASGTGGGFVLLTGDIGTGKTTICRCFLEQIPAACHVAYIFNPKLTVTELLQSVCEEFHITAAGASGPSGEPSAPTLKNYIDALNAFLLRSHAAGQSSVLIIDEAQNLSADVLEQLRLLTNLETNERKLLQIVLIGQPELRAMLERPELEQLAQRVIARFHLDALTEAESAQYIGHRLGVAGHVGPLPFETKALQRIHRRAHGVPRRLNLLCGRALLGAWANGLHRVNAVMVDKAAAEVFGQDGAGADAARQAGRPAVYALGGLALLAGAALVGFLMGRSPPQQALAAAPSRLAVAALALPAASRAGVSAPGVAVSAASPVEEIQALLAQLPGDINAAWRALAPAWKLPATDADPCQSASVQPFQCYRSASLSVLRLRQLGRPGILTLQADGGAPVYAVLTGLSDQSATLQIAGRPHSVRLVSLVALWRGDFATFWRPPPGYSPGLRGDGAGPALAHLGRQLALLDGAPVPPVAAPPVLDAALRERIQAFQRAQGLEPDGLPGPMTFMQIDNATDAAAPRLQTNLR